MRRPSDQVKELRLVLLEILNIALFDQVHWCMGGHQPEERVARHGPNCWPVKDVNIRTS